MSNEPISCERIFHPGDVIRHFKRDFLSEEEKKTNKYLYKVICVASHTEGMGLHLVYESLYAPFMTFCRPLDMALSPVDRDKYPDAKQDFCLEIYDIEED